MVSDLESTKTVPLSRDDYVAVVAHELRGPLGCIRTAVECLRLKRLGDADAERTCAIINRQVELMTRLVNDLLDVGRVGRGMFQVEKRRVELAGIVQCAIDASRPLIESRRQQLSVSFAPGPVWLSADPDRLTQVIANLLCNAAKYTPHGGNIWLHVTTDGSEAVVQVRDDGIGISREMLGRVFEPFVQEESASRFCGGGLGIGLPVAERLVEMHGGRIHAFSRGQGQGSEFVVRLPLAREVEESVPA